jgi:hypothetical protein
VGAVSGLNGYRAGSWHLDPGMNLEPPVLFQFQTKWEKEPSILIYCNFKIWKKMIKILMSISISAAFQISRGTEDLFYDG